MRNWNQGYMDWSKSVRMRRDADPILIHIYSEVLQKFRLAAQGKRPGKQPPEHLRSRIETYFDPLPFFHEPLELQVTDRAAYPLNAVTQRPLAMYHSMTKCTLCVDRIYSDALPPQDRRPACVMACPTNARLFGDVHDPTRKCRRRFASEAATS